MQKIGGYGELFIFSFESTVEKEIFKETVRGFPGVNEIRDREGGKMLKIYVIPGSFAERFFKNYQAKPSLSLNKEDILYYLNLFFKHPLIKLFISASLLGIKAGILTFLICSQIVTPLIRKTV